MRLLFVCDYRSPTSQNWTGQFRTAGHEVHVISTYPVEPIDEENFRVYPTPIAFAQFAPQPTSGSSVSNKRAVISPKGKHLRKWAMGARDFIAPIEIRRHVKAGKRLVQSINPDLVHALRIPYEGMFASLITPPDIPLLVSIWGLDLELQATQNPLMSSLTRDTLRRTDGLLADCSRDIRLSANWGFDQSRLTLVVPGAGGVDQTIFHDGDPSTEILEHWKISPGSRVILNPRGFRGHVRTFELLEAFSLVLRDFPEAVLVAPGFEGNIPVEARLNELGIRDNVRLGPVVSQRELSELFRLAEISASPSTHDGTPNSLLEAMASACFPVVGDIESIREWITHEYNGLLCDPMDPQSIAFALIAALKDDEMRKSAKALNLDIVKRKASRSAVTAASANFYDKSVTTRIRR